MILKSFSLLPPVVSSLKYYIKGMAVVFSTCTGEVLLLHKLATIDNYAKDGGPGRSNFCVVFTTSLCTL